MDPETAQFNRDLEALLAAAPAVNEVPIAETRRAREQGNAMSGPVILSEMAEERTIPGPGGPLTLRIFAPEQARGIYLHIHGGGWVFGRAHLQDARNEQIARNCDAVVISVDYRLAPEHPYPAALDDCEAAARWVVEHGTAEFGVTQLVIGGESAGAHLSATTLLRMRDRHGFTGCAGVNLVYGVYDLSMTPSQRNWGTRSLVLSTPIMHWFCDRFVARGGRREPRRVAAVCAAARPAAGAVHGRHPRSAARRHPVHVSTLARGRQPGHLGGVSRRAARVRRTPHTACATGAREDGRIHRGATATGRYRRVSAALTVRPGGQAQRKS